MTLVCFADAQADSSPAFVQLSRSITFLGDVFYISKNGWQGHKVAVDTLRHDFCTSERDFFFFFYLNAK